MNETVRNETVRTDTVRQPGGPLVPGQPEDFDPVGEARRLLRSARTASLATLEAGYPFVTLATVATDLDGTPLLLLSRLSAHTRAIEADARVSLLLAETGKGDPLAHPRLTLTGSARRADAADVARLRARFLARHPKSKLYIDFPDFGFFRVAVEGGHLNGGFARAARLSGDELRLDAAAAAALADSEAGAVEHMNADHADAVRLYATRLLGRPDGPWRLAGLDPEGADLVKGEETARLVFPAPVASMGELRKALVDLAAEARDVPA